MADDGLPRLTDDELRHRATRAASGEPLPAGEAVRALDELLALRAQLDQAREQVLSNEMLLDCKITAGVLLDAEQAARVDLASQAQRVAHNQLAILDELERVRFILDGGDETA